MVRDIKGLLQEIFQHCNCPSNNYWSTPPDNFGTMRYLEIPFSRGMIEVPTFAFNSFLTAAIEDYPDLPAFLVAKLKVSTNRTYFKTVDSIAKSLLPLEFKTERLFMVQLREDSPIYYMSHGLILNADFKPIVICSWLLEEIPNSEEIGVKYKFVRPIVRIAPSCFLEEPNTVSRFIANKLFKNAMNLEVAQPTMSQTYDVPWRQAISVVRNSSSNKKVIVEVGNIPFNSRYKDSPSISTTNDKIMEIARNCVSDIFTIQ